MTWTDEQRLAIRLRAGTILVSAAAGSGKTAVLTERIVTQLSEQDASGKLPDITDFLLLTFTNAAAAEMRKRIADRLSALCAADPGNRHLRKQLTLMPDAKISTVSAYCLSLIREHFHHFGVRPDFRLASEEEARTLLDEALDETLDDAFQAAHPDFAALADTYARTRSDKPLGDALRSAYLAYQSVADRDARFAEKAGGYCDHGTLIPYAQLFLAPHREQAAYYLSLYQSLLDTANADTALANYCTPLQDRVQWLSAFCSLAETRLWDVLRAHISDFPKSTARKNKRTPAAFLSAYEPVKDGLKRWLDALKKTPLVLSEADNIAQLEETNALQSAFYRLLIALHQAFSEKKQQQGLLDFSDVEHLVYAALTSASGTASGVNPFTAEISRQFKEILVDEYQDTNALQDGIFRALAAEHAALFFVGDVKQSIYQFRQADPSIFLEKRSVYRALAPAGVFPAEEDNAALSPLFITGDTPGWKISLSGNFRSGAPVLDTVNHVFSRLMTVSFGNMCYEAEDHLLPCRTDAAGTPPVELHILDVSAGAASGLSGEDAETDAPVESDESGDEEAAFSALEKEAAAVANRIQALLSDGQTIREKNGGERPIRYDDIAVLLRSAKNRAPVFARIFKQAGIPVSGGAGDAFYETEEVRAVLSLLAIVANPDNDVALIGALTSPFFGFSYGDAARIRAAGAEKDSFFAALHRAADAHADPAFAQRCADFLAALSALRLAVADRTAGDAVQYLLDAVHADVVFAAVDGAALRLANIRHCVTLAREYEPYGGFHDFVRHFRRMADNDPSRSAPGGASEGVRLLTIHASKGLEYPVVILACLSAPVNISDAKHATQLHPEHGFACRLRVGLYGEQTTLKREAFIAVQRSALFAEELRILYVAMTRARDRLILFAAQKNTQAAKDKLHALLPAHAHAFRAVYCRNNPSPGAWLLAAFSDAAPSAVDIRTDPCPYDTVNAAAAASPLPEADPALVDALRARLSFQYPYAETALPARMTATLYKRLLSEREPDAPAAYALTDKPHFIAARDGMTAAERGIVTHLAMQLLPVRAYPDIHAVEAAVSVLRENGQITPAQAAGIRCDWILQFYRSAFGKRLVQRPAHQIRREFKFSILTDAAPFFPDLQTQEDILLQGVIDLFYEKADGSLGLLDFKTDAVFGAELSARAEEYRTQLDIYAHALTEITGQNVSERHLYFFASDTLFVLS